MKYWTRREVMQLSAALGIAPSLAIGEDQAMLLRPIPGKDEQLPVIGLGTYDVFDVSSTPANLASRADILNFLTDKGGSVIDTSPMYNRSEKVIGDVIGTGVDRDPLFLATKVWINGKENGVQQMRESAELMRTKVVDLMQVHNLRDTAIHMATIRDWQEAGTIRYSGLTHYTAGAHTALAREMEQYKPDFIQINYSLGELEAEQHVLPLAQDLGIAVLINRPFVSGRLFRVVSGEVVPEWATSFANSWGQFFLKFIISHPAVTCVIPATSKPHHMADNLGAGFGEMPDTEMRKRMQNYIASL